MRIGIDCRTILNPEGGELAGVGMYTYQLVLNMAKINKDDEMVLFFDKSASSVAQKLTINDKRLKIIYFPEWKIKIPFIYSHWYLGKWLNKFNLDVLHAPAYTFPIFYKGKVIITVHDLAIYKNPHWFPEQKFSTKFLVPYCIRNAAHIISVSQNTKKDIVEIFGVDQTKISVIHLGFDPQKFSSGSRKPTEEPYILSVGTLQPRKNHIGLIRAYSKLSPDLRSKYKLVIVGNKGWMYRPIFEEVKKLGLESSVTFTDYVNPGDLPELYRSAEVFVFPSFYEGFGLPLLEAMASGAPVISSNTSSLPEVGGEVPVYVHPNDTEGLAAAIEKVLTDDGERRRQLSIAPAQVQKFSWEKTAQLSLDVYRRTA